MYGYIVYNARADEKTYGMYSTREGAMARIEELGQDAAGRFLDIRRVSGVPKSVIAGLDAGKQLYLTLIPTDLRNWTKQSHMIQMSGYERFSNTIAFTKPSSYTYLNFEKLELEKVKQGYSGGGVHYVQVMAESSVHAARQAKIHFAKQLGKDTVCLQTWYNSA